MESFVNGQTSSGLSTMRSFTYAMKMSFSAVSAHGEFETGVIIVFFQLLEIHGFRLRRAFSRKVFYRIHDQPPTPRLLEKQRTPPDSNAGGHLGRGPTALVKLQLQSPPPYTSCRTHGPQLPQGLGEARGRGVNTPVSALLKPIPQYLEPSCLL